VRSTDCTSSLTCLLWTLVPVSLNCAQKEDTDELTWGGVKI